MRYLAPLLFVSQLQLARSQLDILSLINAINPVGIANIAVQAQQAAQLRETQQALLGASQPGFGDPLNQKTGGTTINLIADKEFLERNAELLGNLNPNNVDELILDYNDHQGLVQDAPRRPQVAARGHQQRLHGMGMGQSGPLNSQPALHHSAQLSRGARHQRPKLLATRATEPQIDNAAVLAGMLHPLHMVTTRIGRHSTYATLNIWRPYGVGGTSLLAAFERVAAHCGRAYVDRILGEMAENEKTAMMEALSTKESSETTIAMLTASCESERGDDLVQLSGEVDAERPASLFHTLEVELRRELPSAERHSILHGSGAWLVEWLEANEVSGGSLGALLDARAEAAKEGPAGSAGARPAPPSLPGPPAAASAQSSSPAERSIASQPSGASPAESGGGVWPVPEADVPKLTYFRPPPSVPKPRTPPPPPPVSPPPAASASRLPATQPTASPPPVYRVRGPYRVSGPYRPS